MNTRDHLSCLRLLRDVFLECLDTGAGSSPFSDAPRPSLAGTGTGPEPGPGGAASWITMTSSLLCWPRCSLAKSKPLTVGACNWGTGSGEGRRWEECSEGRRETKARGTDVTLALTKDKQHHIQNVTRVKMRFILWPLINNALARANSQLCRLCILSSALDNLKFVFLDYNSIIGNFNSSVIPQ